MEKITLRQVKWHPKTNRICQIPKEGLEFAMLSPKYEQINQLVWCKDFMQDLIWSYVTKTPIDIYGFKYNPKESPSPSMRNLKLLVANYKDHDFGQKLENNVLPLLHAVEDRLKIPHTKLEKCKNPPATYRKSGAYILVGSKRWMKATPMISLYTLLIRIGMVHTPGETLEDTLAKIKDGKIKSYYDKEDRDKGMIAQAIPGINRIIKFSDRKLFPAKITQNYPTHFGSKKTAMCVFAMHDSCGIVGFARNTTKNYFPNWHTNKE